MSQPGAETYENIRYEVRGRVAVITYDRQARRNAIDLSMYLEMVAAVERANADDGVGAIVLTNAGPVFCAGTDIKAAPPPRDPVTGRRPNMAGMGMADDTSWLHLLRRSKPSLAAVAGAAIGLGITHVLACDIRMGSQSSTYSFPFLARGTMPEFGCSALLPQLVGYGRALDICLSSAAMDAAEAERIGLITRVVPDGELMDQALALAEKIAGYAAVPLGLTRGMFHGVMDDAALNAVLTRERDAFIAQYRLEKAAREAG
ncbi:MAG: enoyl-CoA hydratase/carnithine racemase [Phenylobacterium sp.]|nr:enoyl-CoA hydratase/carnithine racemase [Phenylobacterium sp.]